MSYYIITISRRGVPSAIDDNKRKEENGERELRNAGQSGRDLVQSKSPLHALIFQEHRSAPKMSEDCIDSTGGQLGSWPPPKLCNKWAVFKSTALLTLRTDKNDIFLIEHRITITRTVESELGRFS